MPSLGAGDICTQIASGIFDAKPSTLTYPIATIKKATKEILLDIFPYPRSVSGTTSKFKLLLLLFHSFACLCKKTSRGNPPINFILEKCSFGQDSSTHCLENTCSKESACSLYCPLMCTNIFNDSMASSIIPIFTKEQILSQ